MHSRVRRQLFPDHPVFAPRLATLLFAARIDLNGASDAESLFAHQVRHGEFVQFIAPGTAVILSHAGAGHFGILIAVPDLAVTREVTTPDHARELACRLVRASRRSASLS